jgi:retron-type reverse transcriptase
MDRLVQQLNLTAKTKDQKITEYRGYGTEPHRRTSHKILNVLDIRLNEEETICLFLWLFNDAFSAFNV